MRYQPGLSERLARSRTGNGGAAPRATFNPSELSSSLGAPLCAGPSRCFKGGKISERRTMGNAPEPVRVAGAQGPGEPSFPAP